MTPLEDNPAVTLLRLGAQGVSVDDDSASLKRDPSATDQDNNVAGLDGELRLRNGAFVVFEGARSGYIEDEDTDDRRLYGTAWRVMPAIATRTSGTCAIWPTGWTPTTGPWSARPPATRNSTWSAPTGA